MKLEMVATETNVATARRGQRISAGEDNLRISLLTGDFSPGGTSAGRYRTMQGGATTAVALSHLVDAPATRGGR